MTGVKRLANNAQVQLARELPAERMRLRFLLGAEAAAGGLPVERTALGIVQLLGVSSFRAAIHRQQAIVDQEEQELRLAVCTQDQGQPTALELQHNIDRTIADMRSNGC